MGIALAAFAATVVSVGVHGQAQTPTGIITGVVQGASGPEAGVWVIAETKDLPTNFIKIVVTNDQGRFMLPELPAATYRSGSAATASSIRSRSRSSRAPTRSHCA